MGDTDQTTQNQTSTSSKPELINNKNNSNNSDKTNNKKKTNRQPKKPSKQATVGQNDSSSSSTTAVRNFKNRAQSRLTSEGNDNDQTKPKQQQQQQRKKKINNQHPKGDDLSSVLAHGLRSSSYECMICMDIIRPAHHTWTCDCCWAVFHLNCVNQWANKSLKDTSSQKLITQWRCPGCQHTRTAIPRDYFCFCGKQRNPETSKYSTPHSCEQLCKRHKSCPHPCVLPCHPGPCPPCSLMGPKLTCFCGETTKQSRCTDTDYNTKGYSCERPCEILLGCGKHQCSSHCHKGLCEPCKLEEIQTCYCGRHERKARCGTGQRIQLRGHVGYYSCDENRCDSVYQCGIHPCLKQKCHPCESNELTCPLDPTNVTTCPCGSHSIKELLPSGHDRSRCTDEIPTCESKCNKLLSCGLHPCPRTCHLGDCSPCNVSVEVFCRCQSTKIKDGCAYVCEAAGGEPPLCNRICKSNRNCGHHICGQFCCPASKVNGKRRPGTEHEHDCPETCNRLLACRNHRCEAKCHKGKCQPCLEATFDELSCHCGRTQLEPPIRCGTKVPDCNYPCVRPNPCGHVRFLQHNCHPDEETCPPCPVLVSRRCLCGKTELKNVPCFRDSPRCGQPCGKALACGRHVCRKSCHDGPCLSTSEEACEQICGSTRGCGHPCQDKCHGHVNTSSCPEDIPCTARIRATCQCGQNAMEIPCHATSESSGSNQELECNDFCAKVLRNKRLALALDIKRNTDITTATPLPIGYYDASLCEFYLENPAWCRHMEDTLIRFVNEKETRTFYFKPMRSQFRQFLHRYAVHFNVKTEAVDPDPHRSVVLRKTMGDCRIPPLLLSKTARNPTLNKSILAEQQQLQRASSALSKHPINALYLSNVMAGMTKLELDSALATVLKLGEDNIPFVSTWADDQEEEEEGAIVTPLISERVSMDEKELILWQLKRLIMVAFEEGGENPIIGRVDCCWISQKGKLLWIENKKKKKQEQQQQQVNNNNKFDTLKESSDSDSSCHDNNDGWMQVGQINPYKPVVVDTHSDDAWKESPLVKKNNIIFEQQQQVEKEIQKDDQDKSIQNVITADDWEDLA